MSLKISKEQVRTKNKVKFSRQILVLVILALFIIAILMINYISSAPMRDVVEIAVFKNSVGQNDYISKDMLTNETMTRSDYEKSAYVKMSDGTTRRQIVLYDDISSLVGKYAANYIRKGTPIYYDEITAETAKAYSYLYQMDGTELLKIDVDPKEFGNIIVPGDRLNIRVNYKENSYELPTLEEYQAQKEMGISSVKVIEKSELLFSEVTILDMLNKDGESIFDKYYALVSLPKAEREKTYASEEFKKSIQPKSVLISATAEQAERYSRIMSKSSRNLVTLLPRTSSNTILDALNSLNTGSKAS